MAQPTVFDRVLRPNVKGWRELQRALELLQGVSATFFDNLTGDPTTYTPTWTAVSANPSIGNGTLTGQYFRFFRFAIVSIYMLRGSTTSNGTGAYAFTLPIEPLTDLTWAGQGVAFDLNVTTSYAVTPIINLADDTVIIYRDASGNRVGATNPFTWATGDWLSLNIAYPIESETA